MVKESAANPWHVGILAVVCLLLGGALGAQLYSTHTVEYVPRELTQAELDELKTIEYVELECDVNETEGAVDYKEIALEEALAEYEDDLDDSDVTVTVDRDYLEWSIVYNYDKEEGDWLATIKVKLELYNEDDAQDAEDDDEDYDAPTEIVEFEVFYDASRDRFNVDWE